MVEAEVAFVDRLEELLRLIERFVKTVSKDMLDSHEEEITYYRKSLELPESDVFADILDKPYRILDFDEACTLVDDNQDRLKSPLDSKKHLTREHEMFLVNYCKAPVFLVKWPLDKKPFYAKSTIPDYVITLYFLDVLLFRNIFNLG